MFLAIIRQSEKEGAVRDAVLDYLRQQRDRVHARGRALDCCSGPEDYGLGEVFPDLRIERCDQTGFEGMTYRCDVHDLSGIPDDRFEVVFLLEALEHIERPHEALSAVRRVLKPEGILVLSTVMDFPIHRHPHDFWRFCPDGLAVLLEGFRIEDLTIEGRREKPQGLWVTATKSEGSWRTHNLALASAPNRVHNSLTRWFAFKENLHYRIARLLFGARARQPPGRF